MKKAKKTKSRNRHLRPKPLATLPLEAQRKVLHDQLSPGQVVVTDPIAQTVIVRDMTVPERLRSAAGIYEERNKVYGSDYQDHGRLMRALFGDLGMTLVTEADFIRYNLYKQIAAKMARYAKNFFTGGHADSLDDIAVYAQMLREMDDKINREVSEMRGGGGGN